MSDQAKCIMVVDNEVVNRKLLEDMLVPLGYQVFQAANGETALQMIRVISPDVILLDIMMPHMDGIEVARRLRQDEKTKDIPIVMVTDLREAADRVKALEAGANDFLSRPVDRAELQATVNAQVKVKAYHDLLKKYQQELEAEVSWRTGQILLTLKQLELTSIDTIIRLAKAAEYKDEETGVHIKRMSAYAAALARKLDLGSNLVRHILYAAPLHDIGKIGIPERILLKPGKLDSDEWEIMKQHTIIGADILKGAQSGYLKLAEIIALTHHERWDGSGYPRGLKGKAIPLVGQIIAVVDVFDALTSRRPYKEPFSVVESLAILKESRGSQFDPKVVEAFLEIKDEILIIKNMYADNEESILLKMSGQPSSSTGRTIH